MPKPSKDTGRFSISDMHGAPIAAQPQFRLSSKPPRRCGEGGLETRSVFVDIEAPAIGNLRRRNVGNGDHPTHAHEIDRKRALQTLQANFGPDLQILTGSRGQLSAATVAFQVAREHIPPRDGERGHSINHSSLIYMLDPRARVAGYGYHTSTPNVLVETVKKLKRTKA